MLSTGQGSVRMLKNCDLGLQKMLSEAYRGHKAAFSRPRSQFFTLRTEPYPVNNNFFGKLNEIFSERTQMM